MPILHSNKNILTWPLMFPPRETLSTPKRRAQVQTPNADFESVVQVITSTQQFIAALDAIADISSFVTL